MTGKSQLRTIVAIVALAAAAASCGDVVRSSRSPMLLQIDSLQAAPGSTPGALGGNLLSDVLTIVTQGGTCSTSNPCPTIFNDVGEAQFHTVPKDIGNGTTTPTPTTNNEVTITGFHVEYKRADGRNTPGVDVPYPFDGAATATITSGSTVKYGFEIVRSVAKEESPLVQLQSSPSVLTTICTVTFYGHDTVGNAVSASGSIQIDFANFGDK